MLLRNSTSALGSGARIQGRVVELNSPVASGEVSDQKWCSIVLLGTIVVDVLCAGDNLVMQDATRKR